MAAINAAGYDADLDSPSAHPLRRHVRERIAAAQPASLPALKEFFQAHRQKDWTAELSQYVSFALLVEGPPDFKFKHLTYQLPPDVIALREFGKLLARFDREAGIEELWQSAQPAIDQAAARYQEPVTRALLEINGYLRNPTSGYMGRRFQIYLDLLAAPHQIQTRSYADDYYIVLTPSAEPQIDYVRQAYLNYLLDPLVARHAEEVNRKKALGDFAIPAPLLSEHYKRDFLLLTTASLARAVESRLARPSARQAMVDRALREGYILTPHFAEQLPLYENQELAMRFYFPEMIASLDLRKEDRRLANVEFATAPLERKVRVAAPPPAVVAGPEKILAEADELYAARTLGEARERYLRVLRETSEKLLQSKSYYGLARIAALENDPELAMKLFQRVLELGPDAQVKAWTLVYLGRLADLAGQRDDASGYYRAALAVEGATQASREAAARGMEGSFQRK